jgi:hypothetical protein
MWLLLKTGSIVQVSHLHLNELKRRIRKIKWKAPEVQRKLETYELLAKTSEAEVCLDAPKSISR